MPYQFPKPSGVAAMPIAGIQQMLQRMPAGHSELAGAIQQLRQGV